MSKQRVIVAELKEEHLPFLFELRHTSDVMRYADELPWLRGWAKSDDIRTAWATYRERRATLGQMYTQFILSLTDGVPTGESFFAPLPEGYTFGKWKTRGSGLSDG